jgi:Raf kinase inhibitor-like YbhB/YbcL family protein
MEITSSGVDANGKLLQKYTPDGDNCNPPLTFSQVPTDAASLVLLMDDPDAPNGVFTHWVLYDMSPSTLQILEASMPLTGKVGANSYGNQKYDGPAPPSGTHRYVFTLYALNTMLELPDGANKQEILQAMNGHILDHAELTSTYTHS